MPRLHSGTPSSDSAPVTRIPPCILPVKYRFADLALVGSFLLGAAVIGCVSASQWNDDEKPADSRGATDNALVMENGGGMTPENRLAIDREFESARIGIRLIGLRLQRFQIEGNAVTGWHEVTLDSSTGESTWREIARLDTASLYPAPADEGPPIIHETDELHLEASVEGKQVDTLCPYRVTCPPELFGLSERLEAMAQRGENLAVGAGGALHAERLDPAQVEGLRSRGASFPMVDAIEGLPGEPARRACSTPGWLIPIGGGTSTVIPNVLHATCEDGHFRLRRLDVRNP